MGRTRRKPQLPKFDFRNWRDKPIPIHKTIAHVEIDMDESSSDSESGKKDQQQRSAFQPFMRHLVKEERTERDLVTMMASNKPIPIPGVTPLPDEKYNKLYPVAYPDSPPPLLIQARGPEEEVDVEPMSEEEYFQLYLPSSFPPNPARLDPG